MSGGVPEPTTNGDTTVGDVTKLLAESASGSTSARDRLATLLYAELHGMARSRMLGERRDHTLGATGLVNETFVRLFQSTGAVREDDGGLPWRDRRAFFAAAATAMRRVLIDHARSRNTAKRGGRWRTERIRVEADAVAASESLTPHEFLALDEAMQALEQVDERAAKVTQLRFFGGQDIASVAELLEVSERTVKRDWEFARAWLHDAMRSACEAETGDEDE
ncbi:MAG: ECF-type sigma factor [Planctomycetota bacterium]